jgi:hypothetical protein
MAKRDHAIRIPLSLAELRIAKKLSEKLDTPMALLVRKFLRDLAKREGIT